jgi:adenylate cyclase class IV
MQNVEFKAELMDIGLARSICRAIGAHPVARLEQTDIYYRLPDARLKKRETEGEPTEWILYERPSQVGAKLSTFHIYSEDEAAERFGELPRRPWVTVRKSRELWMLGYTRIHLDEVESLGMFVEFEALICARQKKPDAQQAVLELRKRFMPALGEPVSVGYSDLVAAMEDSKAGSF